MESGIRIGIIGGTGLETALLGGLDPEKVASESCPTPFGSPSSPVITGMCGDVSIALIARHGIDHLFNPAAVPYRANIFALKSLGCTHVLALGATGSLRQEIAPGDLVICDQLIDRTLTRRRTFYEKAAVHVEFAEPFCPVMRRWLDQAAASMESVTVHSTGTYVCIEGPSFSTRAESHLYRQWGADLVGMTALPEARLAREAELGYALVALPVDYDCWRERAGDVDPKSLLDHIIDNVKRATGAAISLLTAALRDVAILRERPSPAGDALSLAIWTDKASIDRGEVQRLRPLWGKYFDNE